MGIVCGLDLKYNDSGGSPEISISKGVAITSEGFLISMDGCTTSYVRPYSLPESIKYAPFDNSDPTITLHEILSKKPDDDSGAELLDDDPAFLDNKFVLLFLEIYDNDLKACLGNTCDDLGIDRMFTIRKLLISKDDLNELLEHAPNIGNLFSKKYSLPYLVMPRTLFNPEKDHSTQFPEFTAHHVNTIKPVFEALFGDGSSDGALHQTYSVYDTILGAEYSFENPFDTPAFASHLTNLKKYLDDAGDTSSETYGIQYFCDFLADLILAYNEFRETAFDLMSECCPDMTRFPRHVMLGRAVVHKETPAESVKYRHGFVQPPIYNDQKELIQKTISLHKRLVLMVQNFGLDRISKPEDLQLRITPSNEKTGPLSLRSVPHYYDAKKESLLAGGTLWQLWNFDLTRKMKAGSKPALMAYENQSADQSTPQTHVETPLYFDLNPYPFLRIEGHLGKPHSEIIKLIEDLKHRFNLPFNAVALQLSKDGVGLDIDYSCGFEDLQEEYTITRNSYCGLIKDMSLLLPYLQKNQDTFFDDSAETKEDLQQLDKILIDFEKLCELMPQCLNQFNFSQFQSQYKIMLEQLLEFILVDQDLLKEIDVDKKDAQKDIPLINGLIQRISPPLMKIIDLLFYNTFLRLFYAFKRREHYLRKKTDTFSGYLSNHPGMDHQAGVPKGGTFIVVYNNDEEPTVIADFTLPYLCCTDDRCVPVCDDTGDEFKLELPPFARPDYAITTMGQAIKINVSSNDYGFASGPSKVSLEKESSENGGSIKLIDQEGTVSYEPPAEFSGYDRFFYRLTHPKTEAEDRGRVTVLVKESDRDETPAGCYPASVLECWADGDRKKLEGLYRNRFPNTSIEADIPVLAAGLHDSLKNSGGFTDDELDQQEPLTKDSERRFLLKCIDPSINVDFLNWEQVGDRIRRYQNKNCGGNTEETVNECYSISDIKCWGLGNLDLLLEFYNSKNPQRTITADSPNKVYRTVRQYLQKNNGFDFEDITSGILKDDNQKKKLLGCLGIPFNESMSSKKLGDLIDQYQNKNCGDGITDPVDRTRVELSDSEISIKEIMAVLNARNIEFSEDQAESELLTVLKDTPAGLNFTRDEILLFTKDRMNDILKNREIDTTTADNKNKLAEKLLRGRG